MKELNQSCDLEIVDGVRKEWFKASKGAQRFALGLNGGALPRTPASFTLRLSRYAGFERVSRVGGHA